MAPWGIGAELVVGGTACCTLSPLADSKLPFERKCQKVSHFASQSVSWHKNQLTRPDPEDPTRTSPSLPLAMEHNK